MQENEDSLEDWAESLTELSTMKTDLTQYIMADNVLLLPEQVEHLHSQWEELCFKVSLKKEVRGIVGTDGGRTEEKPKQGFQESQGVS